MKRAIRAITALLARYVVVVIALGALGVGVWAKWYRNKVAEVVAKHAGETAKVKRVYVPTGKSASVGPEHALVTVVAFADFHCIYCRDAAEVRRTIVSRYSKHVRWVFKHFAGRSRVARAAAFAASKGRFFAVADRLYSAHRLGQGEVERIVAREGLSIDAMRVALANKKFQAAVRADKSLARRLGVRGTPSFFINGRKLSGFWPLPFFDLIVRQEMARARRALARGVPRAQLYRHLSQKRSPPALLTSVSRSKQP